MGIPVVAEHLVHSRIKPLLKVKMKYTTKAYFDALTPFVGGVSPPTFLAAGCRRTTITLPRKKLMSLWFLKTSETFYWPELFLLVVAECQIEVEVSWFPICLLRSTKGKGQSTATERLYLQSKTLGAKCPKCFAVSVLLRSHKSGSGTWLASVHLNCPVKRVHGGWKGHGRGFYKLQTERLPKQTFDNF